MDYGTYEMTVVNHGVFEPEGKAPYVLVNFDCGGEECPVYVYISDAAVDMAYKRLKIIGHDIKTQSVYVLQTNRTLLSGNKALVKVYGDEYKGKVRTKYEIVMEDKPVSEASASRLDQMLREVAEGSDAKKEVKKSRRTGPTATEKMIAEHKADVAAHKDDPEEF